MPTTPVPVKPFVAYKAPKALKAGKTPEPFKAYRQPQCGVPGMDILSATVTGGVKEYNIQFTMGAGHVPSSPSVGFSSVTSAGGGDAGYGGSAPLETPMIITVPLGDTITLTAWLRDGLGTGPLRDGPNVEFVLSAA